MTAEDSLPSIASVPDFSAQRINLGVRAALFGDTEPATLGRFSIRGVLGRGGQATVYDAYDPELERPVALKVFATQDDELEASLREARAVARVHHRNVIEVHEVARDEQHLFLVLERASGGTLADRLTQERELAEVFRLFQDAARGLQAAHGAGLVHRDFKPSNVLLRTDGTAAVSDFGLVGVLARPSELDSTVDDFAASPVSAHRGVGGTALYMAPEQAAGLDVDHRADQFAFAVSLTQALYGRPLREGPFGARTPRGQWIPQRVRRALRRALEPEPKDRHPSLQPLIEALQVRRRGLAVTGWAAAGVLAVTAGVLGQTHDAPGKTCEQVAAQASEPTLRSLKLARGEALDDPEIPVAARVLIDGHAAGIFETRAMLCHQRRDGLLSSSDLAHRWACVEERAVALGEVLDSLGDGSEVRPGLPETLAKMPTASGCTVDIPMPPPHLAGRVHTAQQRIAQLKVRLRFGDTVDAALGHVEDDAQQLDFGPLIASAARLRAEQAQLRGGPSGAAHQRAFELTLEHGTRGQVGAFAPRWLLSRADQAPNLESLSTDRSTARSLSRRDGTWVSRSSLLHAEAGVQLRFGDWDGAKQTVEKELKLLEGQSGTEALVERAAALKNLQLILVTKGEPEAALEVGEQALAVRERIYGPVHSATLHVALEQAGALRALGDERAAISLLEERFAWCGTKLCRANLLMGRGVLEYKAGRYGTAIAALVAVRSELGEQPFALESSRRVELAKAYRKVGAYEEAQSLMETEAADARDEGSKSRLEIALLQLGNIASARGDDRACRGYFEDLLEQLKGREDTLLYAIGQNNLGAALIRLGVPELAQPQLEAAKQTFHERGRPGHAAHAEAALGVAMVDLGELGSAREQLDAAREHAGGDPELLAIIDFTEARLEPKPNRKVMEEALETLKAGTDAAAHRMLRAAFEAEFP